MILKLENTTTHQIYEYEVKDMNNGEKLYFRFDIDTSDLVDGEYILSLYDGEKLVANDLLKIGDYNPSTLQYKKGENTYINVTLDNSVQDNKTVVIETIDTTITPDDGFNSMGKVDVNAQPIYDEGYNVGNAEGYTDGYAEGEAKGVENAGSIIAETARVLNITENGTYLSRYSEPPTPDVITGVFDDGTVFANYAELNSSIFNTNIPATPTTRLEMWYKGDNIKKGDGYNLIIGAGKKDDRNVYQIRYDSSRNDRIRVELGKNVLYYTWDENAWHHILIAKETEDTTILSLWIDEVKIGDFGDTPFNTDSTFYINGIEYALSWGRNANGCFGMVKIDDQTFIPTADGFRNSNTGELLEVAEEGGYIFIDNTPQVSEGNLIKTVNVNVQPKINLNYYNVTFGYSSFTSLPEWVDWENIADYTNLFYNCQQLKDISLMKKINGTSLYSTFQGCKSITGDDIKHLGISNVTSMGYTFYQAGLDYFPSLDTSNVTNFNYCFASCNQLKYVEPIDTSKATNFNQMFYDFSATKALERLPEFDCTNVTSISQYFCYDSYKDRMDNLTDVGGWKNLKIDWTSYGLNVCRNLSYQSCINVLNGLWDFRGNGDETTTRTLKVHQNFLDTVGDEISIGVAKGWVISA